MSTLAWVIVAAACWLVGGGVVTVWVIVAVVHRLDRAYDRGYRDGQADAASPLEAIGDDLAAIITKLDTHERRTFG